MSEKSSTSTARLGLPWGMAFIVIKVWGSALATWSWWWILLAPIPVLFALFTKLGLL